MDVRDKAAALAEIRQLYEGVMEKQDECRAEFDRLRASERAEATSLTWRTVTRAMRGVTVSPMHQDRMALAGAKWDERADRVKYDLIGDEDVASATYFLNEALQYLRRLRTMVRFFSVLRVNPESRGAWQAYDLWEKHSLYRQIAAERLAAGDAKKARGLRQCAKATAAVFDLIVPAAADIKGLPLEPQSGQ